MDVALNFSRQESKRLLLRIVVKKKKETSLIGVLRPHQDNPARVESINSEQVQKLCKQQQWVCFITYT
jgi:hypothetical protein